LPFSLASADVALVTLSIEAEGLVAPSKLYGHLSAATPIAAITPSDSYLKTMVESVGCGKWFENGDASGLAEWILQLKSDPTAAAEYGLAGRRLLIRTASPEVVTDSYLKLIRRHFPKHKDAM
jgi:glycosyltransferase involved in cell wall biosynthesis